MPERSTEQTHQKLVKLLKRRNEVLGGIQRIKGSLLGSEKRLESLKEECRKKNIKPEQLDATIDALHERYELMVAKLEEKVVEAEEALAPFASGETA